MKREQAQKEQWRFACADCGQFHPLLFEWRGRVRPWHSKPEHIGAAYVTREPGENVRRANIRASLRLRGFLVDEEG